ncbi:peptide transporter family 1 isoform X2 [Lycorma delicatula]|uniref:peptide transporter family 1 isoform X2 n=1 Tax=Lycorma delicatula TaxID=130591 RepID=UPI003F515501
MVTSTLKMVNGGDMDLREIITTNGKIEQFNTLLEKEPNENHVKKKLKYLDKDLKYPKAVFFIVSNEFCERFSFYGMRAILSLYLHQVLNYNSDTSTIIYHTFNMFAYFFPLIGGIVADSLLGKFRTILYLSVVYTIGNLTLSFASTPYFGLPQRVASILGLLLIAIGTGGIKPCVSAFGGDQFVLPQQERQLQQFFSIFYFSINAGSLISTYLTPYIRYNVHCFDAECYPLAFGTPALLMVASLVIFFLGKQYYVMKKPEGNILVKVVSCMSHALVSRISNKGEKKSHWLNYAEDKYNKTFIEEIKSMLRVLLLFLPLPVFWALFDQQGSRWTFQATHMNGSLGWLGSIKPEQIQIVNPFLILLLIPLFETVIYPALGKCNLLTRPLQRMSAGGLLAAGAFVVSGLLELQVQSTYAVLPGDGLGQVRIYNGLNCNVYLESNSSLFRGNLNAFESLQIQNIPVQDLSNLPLTLRTNCPSSKNVTWSGVIKADNSDDVAISYLITGDINSKIEARLSPGYDDVRKSKNGNPKLRVMYNIGSSSNVTLTNGKLIETEILEKDGFSTPMKEMPGMSEKFKISIGGMDYGELQLENGGVYTLMIVENNNEFVQRLSTVQPPNSVHILWQTPQYIIITAAEVMFSITGLELSYSQAPNSMKSVLSAVWLLTTSLGNLIVILIAKLKFESQAFEFFSFAALMSAVMLIFILMAIQYRYVTVSESSTEESTLSTELRPVYTTDT